MMGIPTVFVRLTGCPLRCQYCDTAYAFSAGDLMSVDDIVKKVQDYGVQQVTISGGEPLAQPLCFDLMSQLCDEGLSVSIETSGALDITPIDSRVMKVMDLKTPGSLEAHRNRWENLQALTENDQIKIVICDRNDYEWAKKMLDEHQLVSRCEVLFSPSHEELENVTLAEWILEDKLPVRFQVQLHKYIWGDEPGR